MNCPLCQLDNHDELKKTTVLGYKQHYCHHCDKQYNERTGTQPLIGSTTFQCLITFIRV